MAYEVSAASEQSERLVVSVGGVSLVYGEPLDSDREAAEAGDGVVIVAEADDGIFRTDSADVASDLQLLRERVPEVEAAVKIEHKPEPVVEDSHDQLVVSVEPVDPADTVMPAGETSPRVTRTVEEVAADEPAVAEVDATEPDVQVRDMHDFGEDE